MTFASPNRFLLAAAIAIWPGAFVARAQSAPEIREILDRLQKLEDANRTLADEVHSLRQELAAAKSTPAAEVAAQSQDQTQDQINVEKARVDELAQSKVESSQKLPIRVTGMALFNAYTNGRYNSGVQNPVIASLTNGDATGGGSLSQSILGLSYESPQTVLGAKVSGSLNLDFFGGSGSSLDHLVRLRTATISLDWEHTSILVGQDKPIISPRDPTSLAQVGVSPLTGAGNLWLWQPQIRIEQRFNLGDSSGVRLQAGVIQTRELGDEADGYNSYVPPPAGTPPVEHAEPGVEGRFEVWHRWSDTARIEIAPGFHYNSSTVGPFGVPSQLFSLDWLIKPASHLELSGFFYQGQNVADLGALPQGWVFHGYPDVRPVHSTGGWAQLRIPVTDRLAFDFYTGRQDDRNSDLGRGYIGLNAGYFANVMYRIAPNVIVSVEGGQVRTLYLNNGTRLNNHYDLAFAYLF